MRLGHFRVDVHYAFSRPDELPIVLAKLQFIPLNVYSRGYHFRYMGISPMFDEIDIPVNQFGCIDAKAYPPEYTIEITRVLVPTPSSQDYFTEANPPVFPEIIDKFDYEVKVTRVQL